LGSFGAGVNWLRSAPGSIGFVRRDGQLGSFGGIVDGDPTGVEVSRIAKERSNIIEAGLVGVQ
jgi:hypothetical protein